ncbi:hypothetical protein [Bacteroides cellulosilyticus]|uniref:hypothetical protein n=1 Tax=Bacteroides cellulosilyticus TaxID=246787 RepID=UPI0032C0BA49
MAERYYAGEKTHLYVGMLRYFKLDGFRGTNIKTISDLAMFLYKSDKIVKHEKGEDNPLEISSIITELRKVWAVIKMEETEHIAPYGYDVKINQ